jgi:hypothetical protein
MDINYYITFINIFKKNVINKLMKITVIYVHF